MSAAAGLERLAWTAAGVQLKWQPSLFQQLAQFFRHAVGPHTLPRHDGAPGQGHGLGTGPDGELPQGRESNPPRPTA